MVVKNMLEQLFFKQIADFKSPTSRDFGFKQTNILIEELRQIVGDKSSKPIGLFMRI